MKRTLAVAFGAFCATAAASGLGGAAHAAIVFNNTTTSTGMVNALLPAGQLNSLEHGEPVTLGGAGGERIVTSFAMRMRVLGAGACTFNMRLRFYRNDGPGAAPGSLLWDSGFMPRVIDSGADLQYNFAIPNVRVPGTFTWSVQVIGRQGNTALMGPAEYNPPTVGSAPFGFWRNSGLNLPDWQFVNPNEPPFSAQVQADPIPGDVDHNGFVDVNDLLAVVNSWGPCINCGPVNCPADVSGDCVVDVNDLLIVITNWG